MPDKSLLLEFLEKHLFDELEAAINASRDAASYATDEESRASSKWDTQGLEASYLAAGQARQAKELEQTRQFVHSIRTELTAKKTFAATGALISCRIGSGSRVSTSLFWLVPPGAGGRDLHPAGDTAVTCLSIDSPLGRSLLGKSSNEDFTLPNGTAGFILSIR